MNAGLRQCPAFVGVLFLALGAVAIAADAELGEKSTDFSPNAVPPSAAHGLLTRLWNPVPAKPVLQSLPEIDIQHEILAEQAILPEVGSLVFPASDWSNTSISGTLATAAYYGTDSTIHESLDTSS